MSPRWMAGSLLALGSLGLPFAAVAAEPCKLGHIGDLPVTMQGMQPRAHAKINGTDAVFVADSGAFFSMLTPAGARQFNLKLDSGAAYGIELAGAGGLAQTWVARIKTFTIFNIDVNNVPFLVAGNDLGDDVVGVLGQNVFRLGDVDYDLANGMIRLFRPQGTCRHTSFAYWAKDLPYSEIEINSPTPQKPHTEGDAFLNGNKVRVLFDTGTTFSFVTLRAAKRAGVTPEGESATPAGEVQGVGRHLVRTWIAPFASFKIGAEEIRNIRLRFSDEQQVMDADMVLGADFFLSHHIYVAASQETLYFTYNGGPVFNLTTQPTPSTAAAQPGSPEQLDAAGYARRGSASAARHDYEHAIADLTHAIELAPAEPDYWYERGGIYWSDRQPDKALADFDEALKLKPGHLDALVARAQLRLARHDPAEAVTADLDAADRTAPKESAVRLELGNLYEAEHNYPAAIAQFDHWIDAHNRDDVRMASTRNSRCWVRALTGQELDRALTDCNFAVGTDAKVAAFRDSRGLVYLRMGKYEKAIADYDAALAISPRIAWSLYGRGLAKHRLGQTAAGDADIAAARGLQPKLAEAAARDGIVP